MCIYLCVKYYAPLRHTIPFFEDNLRCGLEQWLRKSSPWTIVPGFPRGQREGNKLIPEWTGNIVSATIPKKKKNSILQYLSYLDGSRLWCFPRPLHHMWSPGSCHMCKIQDPYEFNLDFWRVLDVKTSPRAWHVYKSIIYTERKFPASQFMCRKVIV